MKIDKKLQILHYLVGVVKSARVRLGRGSTLRRDRIAQNNGFEIFEMHGITRKLDGWSLPALGEHIHRFGSNLLREAMLKTRCKICPVFKIRDILAQMSIKCDSNCIEIIL